MAVHAFQWAMVPVVSGGSGSTINAASASLADVQAAVNAASDGDTVLIPDGTATWSSGITTTKQIIIRALNTTATPMGTMTRNVTITHAAGTGQLFAFTTGNSYSCGVIGIRFNVGSGTGNFIRFSGTGTKPPLVGDCAFENDGRSGNNPANAFIAHLCLGGVYWNTYFNSTTDLNALGGEGSVFMDSPRSWQTPSTMGMLDVDGNINVYFEDCTAMNLSCWVDIDQRSRAVFRHCLNDGSFMLTHGFTSGVYAGGRHAEVYDCTLVTTAAAGRNMAQRYFWLRMGTILMTGNVINNAVNTSAYAGGVVKALNIGDTTGKTGDDGACYPGWGHDGITDVRDPIYLWSNTGSSASSYGINSPWDGTCTVVATTPGQSDAELFVNLGAKPGWSRYTYPHPLRPY